VSDRRRSVLMLTILGRLLPSAQDRRIFSVECIREPKVLTTRFTVRPGFNTQEYLQHTWGIIKGEIVQDVGR